MEKVFDVAKSTRDKVMLKSLAYFGLRVNELTHLTKADVNLKEGVLVIRGEFAKRKKERIQPIPKRFTLEFGEYVNHHIKEPTNRLFPISNVRVWQIVKSVCESAGITKEIHPHSFRHWYCTTIYESTHDLEKVRDLAGHASIATTGIYTHVSTKFKKDTVDEVFK
jgi:integrase/recombinase XerD